jgi:hypothetical protein
VRSTTAALVSPERMLPNPRIVWKLSDMAYDGKQAKNGAVILLFRRS